MALGLGDGSALGVVVSGVVCPEDDMPFGSSVARSGSGRSVGSAVARSEDGSSVGSSEPPQANNSNGRSSVRAKIPRKSRGVLISIHSLWLLGRGVTALHVPRIAWGGRITCLATRRGGINDPASLPSWRLRCDSAGAGDCAVPRGSANGKKTPAQGRGPKPQSSGRGAIALRK